MAKRNSSSPSPIEKKTKIVVPATVKEEEKKLYARLKQCNDDDQKEIIRMALEHVWQYRPSSLAYMNLGSCYDRGIGTLANLKEASFWYQMALDCEDDNEPFIKEENKIRLSEIHFFLGFCHEFGSKGDDISINLKQAMSYYKKGAVLGNVHCIKHYAYAFLNGEGRAKNYTKSFKIMYQAVEKGDPVAMAEVGFAYLHGRGVEKNIAEGMRLCRLAAAQGDKMALFNLGSCYKNGFYGLKKDTNEARQYYLVSYFQGYEAALKEFNRIND